MTEAPEKVWTILELVKVSEQLLKDNNIDNARLNAELLLADTLQTERLKLYLDFEKPVTASELTEYRAKIKRRLKHEPLQYITGYTEFYGLRFNVNPSVLIPRQETELLVEKTLEYIKESNMRKPRVLEIGTGSGCIAISIAKNCDCVIDATDISYKALITAGFNSTLNETNDNINFELKDFLKDVNDFEGYDIVISNPPYIAAEVLDTLQDEVKNFEPIEALTDGLDGLTFYSKIIECSKNTKNKTYFVLELADNQSEAVQVLFKASDINYKIIKDLNSINRVLTFDIN